jgi:hypothetical protein
MLSVYGAQRWNARSARSYEPRMTDTTPVTATISRLISEGTAQEAILAAALRLFPELDSRELSQVLQCAQAAAERQALRPH